MSQRVATSGRVDASGRNPALTAPSAFDNAAWTKNFLSVTANATTDPFGGSEADSLVEDSSNNPHSIYQAASSVVLGAPYTYSVYAKAGSRSWILLAVGGPSDGTWVNLGAGTLGSTNGTIFDKSIQSVGNGWYKITVTARPSGNSNLLVYVATGDGVSVYTGNGTGNVFLYGAEVSRPPRVASNRSIVPTDIANNNLWLRSDHLTFGGGVVSAWTDLSPSGFSVSQSTPSLQALYNSTDSTFNGFPSVQYDGVDDLHAITGANLVGVAGYTFIYVAAFVAPIPSAFTFIISNFATAFGTGPEVGNTAAQSRGINHSGIGTGFDGATTTIAEIVVARWASGFPTTMRVNGIAQALSSPPSILGSFSAPDLAIGARPNGLQNAKAKVVEVIAYSRPLADGELIRIERYLGARYAIATF